MPHPNTHGYKNPPIIFEAYSSSGSRFKEVQIDPSELNFYIHTKNPKANVNPHFTR